MTDLSEFERADRMEALRRSNENLSRQLREAKNRVEELVRATHQGAYEAALMVPAFRPPKPPKDARKKGEEVALWHLTDWQGAKVTTTYNSKVARERVLRFTHKAARITEIQRADHPVRRCVICLGGDMLEGLFNFPTQPYEIDATIFEQYVTTGLLIRDVVNLALTIYDEVRVIAEWGNHGRIGSRRSVVPRADNFDRMAYELARQLLMSEPRVSWEDSAEDIQRVEIGNYRALLCHGDEVGRNGYVSPAQFQNHANKWKAGGYDWDFQDVYVGHYHRHGQEPLADGLGSIYWTGSTESDNRYARDGMGVSGVPSQRLHFIDPDRGRVTAQYQVWLDA